MIQFNNVTKLYGTVIGINDMSMELQGGAYGLLGPNGSGKTTLINLITGQLRPTIGEVRVFGVNPWRDDQLLSLIGLCPAVDVLLPNISAFEWVRYLMTIHGFTRSEAKRRAEEALDRVGMAYAMHRPIGSYSLGMRQRSKLAQAIAHDPELLILDEPFNGLDPIGRHDMQLLLEQWVKDGKSFLLASHLLHEVEAVKPSFLLISGGRLLASGSPAEVRALLVELPNEVVVRVPEPKRLATAICSIPDIESVRIDEQASEVVVATRNVLSLSESLPSIVQEGRFDVTEIRTADGSLQQLFTSLMKIHRGEI